MPKQIHAYDCCPTCESKAIHKDHQEFDGDFFIVEFICFACETEWYERYQIVETEIISEKEQ